MVNNLKRLNTFMFGFIASFCLNCKVAISKLRQISGENALIIANMRWDDFIRGNAINAIISFEEIIFDNVEDANINGNVSFPNLRRVVIRGNSHVSMIGTTFTTNPDIEVEEGSSIEYR